MNHTITTTLWSQYFYFLQIEADEKKITKKSIIEKGLEFYKKHEMEQKIKKWFESRREEYSNINSDFSEVQFNSIKD